MRVWKKEKGRRVRPPSPVCARWPISGLCFKSPIKYTQSIKLFFFIIFILAFSNITFLFLIVCAKFRLRTIHYFTKKNRNLHFGSVLFLKKKNLFINSCLVSVWFDKPKKKRKLLLIYLVQWPRKQKTSSMMAINDDRSFSFNKLITLLS